MSGTLRITLAWADDGREWLHATEVPDGSTVADAIAACHAAMPTFVSSAALQFAIFGQRAAPDTPLADGDRIEFTGALLVDPKFARVARAKAKPLHKRPARRRSGRTQAT